MASQSTQQPFTASGGVKIADLLTVDTNLSIFSSYVRDSSVLKRLLDGSAETTLFAPKNSAILSMSRMPHRGRAEDDQDMLRDLDSEKRAAAFLDQWVSRHTADGHVQLIREGQIEQSVESLVKNNPISITVVSNPGAADYQRVELGPAEEPVYIIQTYQAQDGQIFVLDNVLSF